MTDRFLTISEILDAAQRNLAPNVWDYGSGGAQSEATLRRNRRALERLLLLPRILRDVRQRDLTSTFLGHPLSLPVMVAPVGSIHHFHPEGVLASARAAHQAGTAAFVSTVAHVALERVPQESHGPLVFQLYVRGDRTWVESIVRRVEASGYAALCLTVDSPVYSRRERDLHNRFFPRARKGPNFEGIEPDEQFGAGLNWEFVDWLRSICSLPLILKGVMTPEDARLAAQHGIDVVYVSNHGGRQLDFAPSPIETLAPIVAALDGKADVIVDSGFLHGSDVVKALALGAKAVLIGKLQCFSLAADGEAGLVRALELLGQEISETMALIGATHLSDIGPECLAFDPSLHLAGGGWPA